MENESIINFAIHVLGCGCDHSVFNSIEKNEDVLLDCGIRLSKKIVIGRRLLIYIADAEELAAGDVEPVVREGLDERERCGYNRLRLVIVTPEVREKAPGYLQAFGSLVRRDDRTHIHIVSDEDSI